MSSSILAGERRWVPGPARRGGMTVLGKVVVPKPLNLPSQRLENHGMDPNVEIVPKGSLGWGTRSSSASNPWGSSTLSPNADGTSGRPSTGGGSRPSTAGSDITQDTTVGAWGPNSRPSTASGASTGNQTSTLLRPRSAETRPGSSPLSRFAEPSSDDAGAFGPSGTVDKLVVTSSRNDGFSLSSGDFPTLGSEKDNAGKSNESQDHGSHVRPTSSSGVAVHVNEKALTSQADVPSGNMNPWKRDGSHVQDQHKPEHWQEDPQQYVNSNMPPQQFDSWHGPRMNAPPGVWYGGPPGSLPYPPGGYPMEPYSYYRPQFPAPPMVNSQQGPHPSGGGPRPHHPQNVDLYRPHGPDAYIRPGMPIRPGFYPGPVPYESYYGSPMGYSNPKEKDIAYMGIVGGSPAHGRYPGQSGPPLKLLGSEQLDSGHAEETREPYKVLMKPHNEWSGKDEEYNSEYLNKSDQPRRVLMKNEWGADNRRDEDMYPRVTPGENFGKKGTHSSDNLSVKSQDVKDKRKAVDDRGGRKAEVLSLSSQEVTLVRPITPKDPTLIQKIECLNAKARATDVREDQKNKEGGSTGGDKIIHSSTGERKSYEAVQGRVDGRGKVRAINQESDAWRKKPQVSNSSRPISAGKNQDQAATMEDEKLDIDIIDQDDEDQRAKMRELAKQRAMQLQKEEEERIKEQKAKALAKLEELNRRTQAADGSTHKLEKSPPSGEQSVVASPKKMMHETRDESSVLTLAPNRTVPTHVAVESTTFMSRDSILEKPKNIEKEAVVSHARSVRAADNAAAPLPATDTSMPRQKCVVYKQKQSSMPKARSDVAINELEVTSVVHNETLSSSEPILQDNSQSLPHQKRKNNRSNKSRPKLDDNSLHTANPSPAASGNGKSKVTPDPLQTEPTSFAKPVTDNKDPPTQHLEQHNSEDAQGRGNYQWKPQNPRRVQRNSQANRSAGGGEAVIWAPVRSQNKSETMNEVGSKNVSEVVAKSEAVAVKCEDLGQNNNVKSKRAEMERYVPKPVAKEQLSQQPMASSPSVSPTEKAAESGPEPKIADIKPKQQQGKPLGAWRQRGPVESSHGHAKNVEKFMDQQESFKQPVTETAKKEELQHVPQQQPIALGEWNDGWHMPDEPPPPAAPPVAPSFKDQGAVMGRGKQYPHKSQKNNQDYNKNNNNYGNNNNSNDRYGGKYQDGRRERSGGLVSSSKGRPQSPNEEYSSVQHQPQQQQFSSGYRKNGSQNNNNNRSVRGHEPRGDWISSAEDNNKPPPPNRERHRQSSHLEYLPVANNTKSNNYQRPRDGSDSRNYGSRNRDRAQGQDGRNYYGQRQQADSGNEWQE